MKQLILLSFLLLSLIACQTEKNKTKHTIGVETAIIKIKPLLRPIKHLKKS